MTTMLDKMAEALYVADCRFANGLGMQDVAFPPWAAVSYSIRARFHDAARAALQAIREPSPEMVRAASESVADDGEGGNFGPLCDLLGFSGENKTRLVVAEALRKAVGTILEEKPE